MNEAEYDSIGTQYDLVKSTPFNTVERINFQRHVEPFLQQSSCTVIDFACGTGFYSELLLKWGAKSLTGVDISSSMVDGARSRLAQTPYAGKATFIIGDGTKPTSYHNSDVDGFDIATGCWLIVYARDKEELAAMFRSISTNLKEDGVFIGICYHPTDDLDSRAKAMNGMRHLLEKTRVVAEYREKLANGLGYALRVFGIPPPGSSPSAQGVDFSAHHLKKSIIEESARAGGMHGKIEWRPIDYLGEEWRREIGLEDDDEGWEQLQSNPYLSILVIWKK